jgi:hypothetical protein
MRPFLNPGGSAAFSGLGGLEIVQERHYAINWITGYGGLPWDEVTTDT